MTTFTSLSQAQERAMEQTKMITAHSLVSTFPDEDAPVNLRRAIFVYEGARLQAASIGAPIVPESWANRDEKFRKQFLDTIAMMCGPMHKDSPEELHDDWVKAYEKMGWKYGPVRDPELKTHPDMVPFDELEPREQIKDKVFIILCQIARETIF